MATASLAPVTPAWPRTARACQTKQQPDSCQTQNSTLFQTIIVKEKICTSEFSAEGEATTGEVHLPLQVFNLQIGSLFNQQCVQYKVLNFDSI